MSPIRRALARAWWYLREVFGETAYDNYVAHRRQQCPTGPVLTRREFDRMKTTPAVRCC